MPERKNPLFLVGPELIEAARKEEEYNRQEKRNTQDERAGSRGQKEKKKTPLFYSLAEVLLNCTWQANSPDTKTALRLLAILERESEQTLRVEGVAKRQMLDEIERLKGLMVTGLDGNPYVVDDKFLRIAPKQFLGVCKLGYTQEPQFACYTADNEDCEVKYLRDGRNLYSRKSYPSLLAQYFNMRHKHGLGISLVFIALVIAGAFLGGLIGLGAGKIALHIHMQEPTSLDRFMEWLTGNWIAWAGKWILNLLLMLATVLFTAGLFWWPSHEFDPKHWGEPARNPDGGVAVGQTWTGLLIGLVVALILGVFAANPERLFYVVTAFGIVGAVAGRALDFYLGIGLETFLLTAKFRGRIPPGIRKVIVELQEQFDAVHLIQAKPTWVYSDGGRAVRIAGFSPAPTLMPAAGTGTSTRKLSLSRDLQVGTGEPGDNPLPTLVCLVIVRKARRYWAAIGW